MTAHPEIATQPYVEPSTVKTTSPVCSPNSTYATGFRQWSSHTNAA
jgi:hypothetical protein